LTQGSTSRTLNRTPLESYENLADASLNISVILATCRRPSLLRQTLESLARTSYPKSDFEVLVCDNAGDEETRLVCRNFVERLPIRYLVETLPGKNAALNHALDHASGELLLFTDDDIVAEEDWLEEMWEGARRWPGHSVFGGRVLPLWAGVPPSFVMASAHQGLLFAKLDPDIPEGLDEQFIPFGPNLAIRRSIFIEGHSYDPEIGPSGRSYIMGSETDMLKRLRNSGYPPVYLPRSCVHHQIRPEQYSVRWLLRRCMNYGRMRERLGEKELLSGQRKSLSRLGLNLLMRTARGSWHSIRGYRSSGFDQFCDAAISLGQAYQRSISRRGSRVDATMGERETQLAE